MIITTTELENKLNNFRKNKAFVEATEIRIKTYEELLKSNTDDVLSLIFDNTDSIELGMPRAKGIISKPTEQAIFKKEIRREKVQEWIDEDRSRILMPKLELLQIATALKALNDEERYIIELKYFNKWTWGAIEQEFNSKFRNLYNTYISESGIKKIKRRSTETICEILNNFYKTIQ